jgi:hypothetical protein
MHQGPGGAELLGLREPALELLELLLHHDRWWNVLTRVHVLARAERGSGGATTFLVAFSEVDARKLAALPAQMVERVLAHVRRYAELAPHEGPASDSWARIKDPQTGLSIVQVEGVRLQFQILWAERTLEVVTVEHADWRNQATDGRAPHSF